MGGNSKVLMFVNISPAVYNLNETLCSLTFASRCRNVELGQAKKQTITGVPNDFDVETIGSSPGANLELGASGSSVVAHSTAAVLPARITRPPLSTVGIRK